MFSFIYVEPVKNVSRCLKVASLFTWDISIGTQTLFLSGFHCMCVTKSCRHESPEDLSHCKVIFNVK